MEEKESGSSVRSVGGVCVNGDKDEIREACGGEDGVSTLRGFGEKGLSSDDAEGGDEESCVGTAFSHFATSDDLHAIDYLANNKGKPFLKIE